MLCMVFHVTFHVIIVNNNEERNTINCVLVSRSSRSVLVLDITCTRNICHVWLAVSDKGQCRFVFFHNYVLVPVLVLLLFPNPIAVCVLLFSRL
jgi:hypothetical protein